MAELPGQALDSEVQGPKVAVEELVAVRLELELLVALVPELLVGLLKVLLLVVVEIEF